VVVSFPHTRGDVPRRKAYQPSEFVFSPHAWGCTEEEGLLITDVTVFPTRVGMYRRDVAGITAQIKFSPHAWGCTFRGCVR